VRPPPSGAYGLTDGTLRLATQAGELQEDTNTAPVLTEAAPAGEYTVETRVRLDVPPEGCCQNFVQAGLVIYRDDDNYLKLVHVSIYETRQIEYAKEVSPVPAGWPRYGNTVLGPPADWTYLRIAKRLVGNEERYTAYSSRDGVRWERGGTWTHTLGDGARIGLVAMGGAGFTANFDYVRVYARAAVAPAPAPRTAPVNTPTGMPAPNPRPPSRP
jgi:arabinan endo-1,5-alpha-L-arabinosidase